MQIALSKFLQITAALAAGTSLTVACTITQVDSSGAKAKGGTPNADSAGTNTGASTSGGTASTSGGTASTSGGTASTSGGTASTSGGTASTLPCVSGEPTAEGTSFDCATLPYYSESCIDPSSEGNLPPYGVQLCEQYAAERVDSVKVLTDCLAKLTAPTEGYCGSVHQSAAEACRTTMLQRTCASTAAAAACASIHATCASVTVASCVADLSPLSDSTVSTIEPCMEGTGAAGCLYAYQGCASYPELPVEKMCADLNASCPALTVDACTTATSGIWGTQISRGNYAFSVLDCMKTAEDGGATCQVAFSDCMY